MTDILLKKFGLNVNFLVVTMALTLNPQDTQKSKRKDDLSRWLFPWNNSGEKKVTTVNSVKSLSGLKQKHLSKLQSQKEKVIRGQMLYTVL